MRTTFVWALWLGVLCLVGAVPSAFAAGIDDDSVIVIRNEDKVIMSDHTIKPYLGRIQSEDDSQVTIKSNSGAVMTLKKSEIERIDRRSTAETELARLVDKYKSDPKRLAEIIRSARKKFPYLEPKLPEILEKAAQSGDPDVLEVLVDVYLNSSQGAKAEDAAKRLVQKRNNAASQRLLGQAYGLQGKTDLANQALSQAVTLAPNSEDALVARAEFLLQTGHADDALKIFKDALSKNGQLLAAWVGQGRVQLRIGEVDAAAVSFQKVMDLDKDLKQKETLAALLGLAACKLLHKEGKDAIALGEKVLGYDANSPQAFAIQAFGLLLGGDPDKLDVALSKIDDAIGGDPSEPRFKALKSVLLDRKGQYLNLQGKAQEGGPLREQAATILAELEQVKLNDSWLLYLLAEMRARQAELVDGDRRKEVLLLAFGGFKRCTELAPNYAPAYQALGSVALKLGNFEASNFEAAELAYKVAVKLEDANAEYHAGLGLAYLGQKKVDEGSAELSKALDLNKENVAALCGLGYIMNYNKNEEQARTLFLRALSADGNCAYAADALKRMYQQRDQALDYLDFQAGDPAGWKPKGGRAVKAGVDEGKIRWRGTQGSEDSDRLEYLTELNAEDFLRVEGDLEIDPKSPCILALRVASKAGADVAFNIEIGKDPGGHLSFRYQDFGGPHDWKEIEPWPAAGKARLAIATDDLHLGKVTLYLNGVVKKTLQLQLHNLRKVTAGFAASVPAREQADLAVDNVALIYRHAAAAAETPAK